MLDTDVKLIEKHIKTPLAYSRETNYAWNRIKKFIEEAQKTPTNTQSPKLPKFREIVDGVQQPNWVKDRQSWFNGLKSAYNFIAGKIGHL